MAKLVDKRIKFTGPSKPLPEGTPYPALEWCNQHPLQLTKQFLNKNYPDFFNWIMEAFPEDMRISERLYRFYHPDVDNVCKTCGRPTAYLSFIKGFGVHCSTKCSAIDNDTKEKLKKTSLEKYGVESPNQANSVKAKARATFMERYGVENPRQYEAFKEKARQTSMKNYGVSHPMLSEEVRENIKQIFMEKYGVENPMLSEEVREKAKKTCMERYGVEYTGQIPESRVKFKETCMERYGVETPLQNPEIMRKVNNTNIKKYGVKNPLQNEDVKLKMLKTKSGREEKDKDVIEYLPGYKMKCRCPHPECTMCEEKYYIIDRERYHGRKNDGSELCTRLLPIQPSYAKDTTIELAVRRVLDEYGVKYEQSNRTVLDGKELDIFIPDLNIAIECNGIYWHDESLKGENYHSDKWRMCKDKGIKLLNLWEDWIIKKPAIIKSIIIDELGLNNDFIYPDDCLLCDVSESDARKFLETNYLYGYTPCEVFRGLRSAETGELIAVVSFKHARKKKGEPVDKGAWEIISFCTLNGINIYMWIPFVISDFANMYKPTSLHAYTYNDITSGKDLKYAGFEPAGEPVITHWYIKHRGGNDKYQRIKSTKVNKKDLISEGIAPATNSSEWTLQEVMYEAGWSLVADSGKQKWKANLPKQSI